MIDQPTPKDLARIRKDFATRFTTTTPICKMPEPRGKAESQFIAKLKAVFVHVLPKQEQGNQALYLDPSTEDCGDAAVFVIKGGFYNSTITITPLKESAVSGKNPAWKIHTRLVVYTPCQTDWKSMEAWPTVPSSYTGNSRMLLAFGFTESNRVLTPAFGDRDFHCMSGDWSTVTHTMEDAANAISAILRTDCDQGFDNLRRPSADAVAQISVEKETNPILWIKFGTLKSRIAELAPYGVWKTSEVMDFGVFRIQLKTGWKYTGQHEPIKNPGADETTLAFSEFCARIGDVIPAGVISIDEQNEIIVSPAMRVTDKIDCAWLYPIFEGDYGIDNRPWFDRMSPVQVVWNRRIEVE